MKDNSEKIAAKAGEDAHATPPAVASGMEGGRLITRALAAKILGRGYNTVKRWEGTELHPVRDAQGTHWFREADVRALARRLQQSETVEDPTKHYDGETAARVFRMLDERKPIADVVIALELHPSIARAIAREWADLRGAIVVGAETLARVANVPAICAEDALRTEEELLEALENACFDECEICHHNTPRVCVTCIVQRHRHVVALAKTENARADERARARHERRVRIDAENAARAACNSVTTGKTDLA